MKLVLPSDREILLTCVFDAPRRRVFEAWTRAEHVKRWYGPRGTTLLRCEIDFRQGGGYLYVLRADGDTANTFRGTYHELVPPRRIIYTEVFETGGFTSSESLVTLGFEEQNGKTMLTSTSRYPSVEARDEVLKTGLEKGAAETLGRLADHLRTMS
jgi:uncharacterized protein YndB with AHSA1/START domain